MTLFQKVLAVYVNTCLISVSIWSSLRFGTQVDVIVRQSKDICDVPLFENICFASIQALNSLTAVLELWKKMAHVGALPFNCLDAFCANSPNYWCAISHRPTIQTTATTAMNESHVLLPLPLPLLLEPAKWRLLFIDVDLQPTLGAA